jgi:hypothetical protein
MSAVLVGIGSLASGGGNFMRNRIRRQVYHGLVLSATFWRSPGEYHSESTGFTESSTESKRFSVRFDESRRFVVIFVVRMDITANQRMNE